MKSKEQSKMYYLNNKEKSLSTKMKYYKQCRDAWIKIIKEKHMDFCSHCGFSIFSALDFHHVDPKEKENCISRLMAQKPTLERIKELDKCVTLCANCHRIEHEKIRSIETTTR